MKATNVKRDRKRKRATNRSLLMPIYRKECREEISRMRQQHAPPEEFRATLKVLRHAFTRTIAGRKGAA